MYTRLFFLVIAGVLCILPGCTSMRPNPEYRACVNACNEKKQKCMLNAASAEAINRCDSDQNECMNRCSAIPSMIPAEK